MKFLSISFVFYRAKKGDPQGEWSCVGSKKILLWRMEHMCAIEMCIFWWRTSPCAPQKVLFLWSIMAGAPQNVLILWRTWSCAHRNSETNDWGWQGWGPPYFCGACVAGAPQKYAISVAHLVWCASEIIYVAHAKLVRYRIASHL